MQICRIAKLPDFIEESYAIDRTEDFKKYFPQLKYAFTPIPGGYDKEGVLKGEIYDYDALIEESGYDGVYEVILIFEDGRTFHLTGPEGVSIDHYTQFLDFENIQFFNVVLKEEGKEHV